MPRLLTAALAALMLFPAVASAASTAAFTPRVQAEDDEFDPSELSVAGDAGANTITLALSGPTVTVTDPSGMTAGSGCGQVDATTASCPVPDLSFVDSGEGGDVVTATGLNPDVDAGAGDDVVTSTGNIAGGEGNDTLNGGSLMDGGPGDDHLNGAAAGETLLGGLGTDTLQGGDGNDTLDGDEQETPGTVGPDVIDGGPGTDALDWGSRPMAVTLNLADPGPDGAAGENDQIAGIESVLTGSGADTIVGTDGPETFDPGGGKDRVSAAGGDDRAESSAGDDSLDLGAGSDTLSYAFSGKPVKVNLANPSRDGAKGSLDKLTGVENVIGSEPEDDFKGDVLIGNSGPNLLEGLHGNDRISGGGGADRLYGEGRPRDVEDDSPARGIQIALSYPAKDRLSGGSGSDRLFGGIDSDVLDGGPGNDRLEGDIGPGFRGKETRSAQAHDIADYSARHVRSKAHTGSGGGAPGERDRYSGIDGIRGGSADDVLSGRRKLADFLFGGAGNDRLTGLTGKDSLFGQSGSDTLIGKDGTRDRLDCGSARDRFRADRKDRVKGCEQRLQK
jgi:Ca2+-binding RTX toxin-like protein